MMLFSSPIRLAKLGCLCLGTSVQVIQRVLYELICPTPPLPMLWSTSQRGLTTFFKTDQFLKTKIYSFFHMTLPDFSRSQDQTTAKPKS